MKEEKKTNWKFLFTMILIEFLVILIVFIVERYYKEKLKKEDEEEKHYKEEGLISPPNTLQLKGNKKDRIVEIFDN